MNIKDLVNKAKETENQSEATQGGDYEYTPPAEGTTVGRFIEYVELGKQPEFFKGEEKPNPIDSVRITFELLHPKKNIKEIEVDGGKKQIAERVSVVLSKKMNEKAKFYKLFKAMAYGRTEITHMAEMLNEAFIITIKHNKSADGKRTYANIYEDGVWFVNAPIQQDALAGTSVNISASVPEPLSPLRIFLWSNPTKETWDSLFIDGETEVKKADGTVEKVSKNWLQEKILSAKDYGGSALEQMLAGVGNLPTENKPVEAKAEVSTAASIPEEAEKKPEPKSGDDLLAEMGL